MNHAQPASRQPLLEQALEPGPSLGNLSAGGAGAARLRPRAAELAEQSREPLVDHAPVERGHVGSGPSDVDHVLVVAEARATRGAADVQA